MNISDDDVQALLYCVSELVDRRRRGGVPVPEWMNRQARRLDLAAVLRTSDLGRENSSDEPQLDVVAIDEAAELLHCSTRHVRRIAPDLGGQKVGWAWVFDRATVVEYAKERHAGYRERVRGAPP